MVKSLAVRDPGSGSLAARDPDFLHTSHTLTAHNTHNTSTLHYPYNIATATPNVLQSTNTNTNLTASFYSSL